MLGRYPLHSVVLLGLTLAVLPSTLEAQDTLTMAGLERPVEIIVDRWGIAHIYAETEHDLFFAQGFNAARDRLFQLEIWRRQATGTVAEAEASRRFPVCRSVTTSTEPGA